MSKPTPPLRPKPPRPRPSASSINASSGRRNDLPRPQNDDRRNIVIVVLVALLFLLLLLILFFSTAIVGALRNGTTGNGQSSSGNGVGKSEQAVAASTAGDGSQQAEDEKPTPIEAPPEQASEEASPPEVSLPAIESGSQGDGSNTDLPPKAVTMAGEAESPEKGGRVFTIPGGEFFGIKSQGNKFVYIIDSSLSMSGSPFNGAKQELKLSIDALTDTQSFSVFFFSGECYPMFYPNSDPRLKMATAPNRGKAGSWIDQFPADGGTDPERSIEMALGLQPDVIYLLTDGGFDATIVDRVTQLNKGRVVINAIGFSSSADETVLKAMAKSNRGSYRQVR